MLPFGSSTNLPSSRKNSIDPFLAGGNSGVLEAYTLIEKQHQLDIALSRLSETARIAVDTEFSGYYTYFQEICLIQISSGPYHFVIDT